MRKAEVALAPVGFCTANLVLSAEDRLLLTQEQ